MPERYVPATMGCRFVRQTRPEILAAQFGVDFAGLPFFTPSYNVAPQSIQPVVRLNRDSGRYEFALMRWGLVPFWAKDACWLKAEETSPPIDLLRPYPAEKMRAWPVSSRVGNVRNNDAALVEPAPDASSLPMPLFPAH